MQYTLLEQLIEMLKNRPKSLKTEEIANATKISVSSINKIECGTTKDPKLSTVIALHKFLSSKGIKADV
jgi:transcriptional regulator with XRE-family HTH domain